METLKKNLMVASTLLFLNLSLWSADHTVALTILAEARGEGQAGMNAVACVIAQRALERGLSMRDVCLERLQFSCWNGKKHKDLAPLLKTKQAKHALWLESHAYLLDLTAMQYANHYHAVWMKKKPYWARGKAPLLTIGQHAFYRL
jgi:spore germination cell wall hydrolase CwlJ-like protein